MGRSDQKGMALLPSAVEMLPIHQLWGPNSLRKTTVSAIKVAIVWTHHEAKGIGQTQADV